MGRSQQVQGMRIHITTYSPLRCLADPGHTLKSATISRCFAIILVISSCILRISFLIVSVSLGSATSGPATNAGPLGEHRPARCQKTGILECCGTAWEDGRIMPS